MPLNNGFAAYVGFIYTLMVAGHSAKVFESEMCLEQALTIHAVMKQEECPDILLNADTVSKRCSVLCTGRYTTNNKLYDENHCVGFNITFNLNTNYPTKLKDISCGISRCILEVIDFECYNETLRNRYQWRGTECTEPVITVVASLIGVVVGCGLGICGFIITKRVRKNHLRLQPPVVFYQPNYGESDAISGGQDIQIGNAMESEYADIEDTIKMIAKGIQVPSYKEDSSSETRSRENVYHHLSLIENSRGEHSDLLSNVSIPNSFTEDIKSCRNGSPSIKSVVINAEKLSSKSNRSSKVSPTGSDSSDKYYALEQDYLVPIS
ncbi:uncharacterized protein LOC111105875 [Crassostrea virginica]